METREAMRADSREAAEGKTDRTDQHQSLISSLRRHSTQQCVVIAKMAAVVSKTILSPSKRGFLSNIAPLAGYVAQRSYAIRPSEIPTAK